MAVQLVFCGMLTRPIFNIINFRSYLIYIYIYIYIYICVCVCVSILIYYMYLYASMMAAVAENTFQGINFIKPF